MILKLSGIVFLFLLSISVVFAHGGGGGTAPKARSAPSFVSAEENTDAYKEIHGKLVHEKKLDDFNLRFKVVDVAESVPDGGSHNLLLNIKRDGRTLHHLSVNSVVEKNRGERKSKSMMKLGDWYLAGYDFMPSDEYTITVSFKSPDGRHHSSTINYP